MDFSKRIQAQWTELWLTSPKGSFTKCFDRSAPSPKIQRIFENMSRAEASMSHSYALDTFRSTRIASAREPPHPLTAPTAMSQKRWAHFLLVCERYSDERQALRRRTRAANLQLRHLLSTTSRHTFATLAYVQRTKRFPDVSNNKGGSSPVGV